MVKPVAELSRVFGNAVIIRKGVTDIISDGNQAFYVALEGSKKRAGGQGDILAGTVAAFEQFEKKLVDANVPGLLV